MHIRGLFLALRAHIHRLPCRSNITDVSVVLRKLVPDLKFIAQLVVHQQLFTFIHREHVIDRVEFRRQARMIYVYDVRLDEVEWGYTSSLVTLISIVVELRAIIHDAI